MEQRNIWRRAGYILSFLMVAGVAARVSYSHIRDVALYGHQPGEVAALLPLAVDGMMLIATLAMAEDKAANRHPRGWARSGFWFGAVISTTANVAATVVQHGWDPLSIGVAALAPILLLWAIEIVARPGKPKPAPAITADDAASPSLPEAPVSPAVRTPKAPAAAKTSRKGGRPAIAKVEGPDGTYIREDGEPLKERTERRARTGK